MKWRWWQSEQHPSEDDALATQRERVMYVIAIIAVICLVPFAINDLLRDRDALGFTILGVVLVLAVDLLAIHRKKTPPIPYAFLLIPGSAAIALSLRTQGMIGALWCYPVVLFFYFVLTRRMANLCSFALLGVASLMVYRYISLPVMVRFFVTLTLTIIIINVILNIITDLQRRLFEQATIDPLTGALNRRQLDSSLDLAAERCRRHKVSASLLALDIDHFKRINDELGHAVGDRVLTEIVAALRGRLRQLDLIFRMGGEEFLVLMSETELGGAERAAEDLRSVIAATALLDDRRVTASFGVAVFAPGDDRESWIRRADRALYEAKRGGRNRVHVAG
jgi:diguanylate cyclase (GGDEF)-like protein